MAAMEQLTKHCQSRLMVISILLKMHLVGVKTFNMYLRALIIYYIQYVAVVKLLCLLVTFVLNVKMVLTSGVALNLKIEYRKK